MDASAAATAIDIIHSESPNTQHIKFNIYIIIGGDATCVREALHKLGYTRQTPSIYTGYDRTIHWMPYAVETVYEPPPRELFELFPRLRGEWKTKARIPMLRGYHPELVVLIRPPCSTYETLRWDIEQSKIRVV